MHSPRSPKPAPTQTRTLLLCAGAGLLLGQLVLGMAAHHQRSTLGLVLALVFVLSAGVSLTLFLAHRHRQQQPQRHPQQARDRSVRAPLQAWVLALGAGVLLSIQCSALLGGV